MLLKPKGWLQMVETHNLFQSDNGQSAPFLERWWEYYKHAMSQMGKDPKIALNLGNLLRTAG